jgi:hypothetical protein
MKTKLERNDMENVHSTLEDFLVTVILVATVENSYICNTVC